MWTGKIDRYYPTREKAATTGWLSPSGEFIACGMGEHEPIGALLVCLGAPQALRGWLRISDNWTGDHLNADKLTSSQDRFIAKNFGERELHLRTGYEHRFGDAELRQAMRDINFTDETDVPELKAPDEFSTMV
ncbi:hypothetical protein [Tautonia plasticadhaerens]|uniref:Uncharacterized protein n=1 Tax=Tautonia plasticadhaerens TaxID=2527974 RepID=A0A518H2C0_9BACT|nr:hypothetical protein [Tautonia plasticadhaerens]QDV34978.1 hypothetical protein ElP_28750 [Tautonia plasticadhaerens]